MTLRDPCHRLPDQLLALAEPVGYGRVRPGPRLSHETLADMVGLRRETVTLSLGCGASVPSGSSGTGSCSTGGGSPCCGTAASTDAWRPGRQGASSQ
jgi:hypothetical protein